MTVYVFAEKAVLWISALDSLARMAVALNRRSVLDKSSVKTSWASLPAKQAVTVGFSSGFNVKLLHDWSNFWSSKAYARRTYLLNACMAVSHKIHARIQANKLLITAQPIRNLRTPASAEMKKRGGGVLIAGVPYHLSPIPLSFSLPPYPLSTPATQARWIRKRKAIQTLGNAVTSKLLVPSWRLYPQLHPCFSKIWNWTFQVCFLRILVNI